jgi:nicotinamidase-related amidase
MSGAPPSNAIPAVPADSGDVIEAPIAEMISFFSDRGATVVATRDYHPCDHASFLSEGGPFPSHCVQVIVTAASVVSGACGAHVEYGQYDEDAKFGKYGK